MFSISKGVDLHIHRGKSKILNISITPSSAVLVENKALEEVDSFTNLGSILNIELFIYLFVTWERAT